MARRRVRAGPSPDNVNFTLGKTIMMNATSKPKKSKKPVKKTPAK
jgi:hypothetical protein